MVLCRVDGVELLENAIRQGKTGSESEDDEISDGEDVSDAEQLDLLDRAKQMML